jgi:hypothetical protein
MAQFNDLASLNGLFKDVYAAEIHNMIPSVAKLQEIIKFVGRQYQEGNQYVQPLVLQLEHGVSYGSPEDGAFDLNASISGVVKHARVRGAQMLLRTSVAYDLLARSQNNAGAFAQATKFVVQAMTESMAKKYEVEIFYGQSNIGVVESSTSSEFVIEASEWASGIFCGGKGMKLEIRNAADSAKLQDVTIRAVDFETRTIKVEEVLDPAVIVAGSVIKPYKAHGKQAAGLVKIMSNTGSLFEIDAAQYELWKGNIVDVGGDLTFALLVKHLAKPIEKGLDKDVVAIVSPKTWTSLMKDQAALRRFDSSFSTKKSENGTMAIEFFSLNGKIEVHASTYCKDGYAFIFAPEEFARIGATDVTFALPGMPDQFLLQSPDKAGYEMRCYVNAGLFTKSIGKTLLLKGITHASDSAIAP